jgi:hypothetical protein
MCLVTGILCLIVGAGGLSDPGAECLIPSNCISLDNGTVVYNQKVTSCTAEPNLNYNCIWYTGTSCPSYYYCSNNGRDRNIRTSKYSLILGAVIICFSIVFAILTKNNG